MKAVRPLAFVALSACATLSGSSTGTPSAGLGQTAVVGSLRVRPISVVEDSRCPINAICVWAGRIVVRSEIRGGNWRETRDLELGKPQPIADGTIALVAVEPSKLAGEENPRPYRFTYDFQGGL
jgi:hypothetical protein